MISIKLSSHLYLFDVFSTETYAQVNIILKDFSPVWLFCLALYVRRHKSIEEWYEWDSYTPKKLHNWHKSYRNHQLRLHPHQGSTTFPPAMWSKCLQPPYGKCKSAKGYFLEPSLKSLPVTRSMDRSVFGPLRIVFGPFQTVRIFFEPFSARLGRVFSSFLGLPRGCLIP